jgi:putative FmdB family regulatory protein
VDRSGDGFPRALGRSVEAVKDEEEFMPHYEFLCEKCKKSFERTMTISEREKAKVTCPTCKGTNVVPQLGGFMAQTQKKS